MDGRSEDMVRLHLPLTTYFNTSPFVRVYWSGTGTAGLGNEA